LLDNVHVNFFCVVVCRLREGIAESELVGLALDAERELLYYTDRVQGIIAEITTDGSRRREIFSDQNKVPRAIVVDSYSRRAEKVIWRIFTAIQ